MRIRFVEETKKQIELGWNIWNEIDDKNSVYVILDKQSIFWSKRHELINFLKNKYIKFHIITDSYEGFTRDEFKILRILGMEEMEALIKYYLFYKFSNRFYVADLSIYSKDIQRILQQFSEEEILYIGIFGEREIPLYE